MDSTYSKAGYLTDDFRLFHLNTVTQEDFAFHYHDFHKILILMHGNVEYCVEGRSYKLLPGDIVFVPAGEVHRPVIQDTSCYERIIIYIARDYLDRYRVESSSLAQCLTQAHEQKSHVLRIPAFANSRLGMIIAELENSIDSTEFASELYHRTLFLEFMIQLNRIALRNGIEYLSNTTANSKMIEVIDYINLHLTEELDIDTIAHAFYLSRYHLMHSFKEETGYTIGNYIATKRLLMARDMIEGGISATVACYECGFHNYSTFSRAYRKQFQHSPRECLTASPSAH